MLGKKFIYGTRKLYRGKFVRFTGLSHNSHGNGLKKIVSGEPFSIKGATLLLGVEPEL
jgi:hypothetical protein